MTGTLEDVWDSWLEAETGAACSAQAKELLAKVIQEKDSFLNLLDEKQKDALQAYDDCQNALSAVYEKQAFIKGVRFATGYLLDALPK